jgi:hypothetical protein
VVVAAAGPEVPEVRMNLEKVVFGFFVLLAATLKFGFFIGDIDDPPCYSRRSANTSSPAGACRRAGSGAG